LFPNPWPPIVIWSWVAFITLLVVVSTIYFTTKELRKRDLMKKEQIPREISEKHEKQQ